MGGLRKYMPVTFWTFMIGWVAICGIFPFAGFWSKDEILWKALERGMAGEIVWYGIYAAGLLGAATTAFYMTRQVAMVFFGEYRGKKIAEDYLAKHGAHGHDDHHDDGHHVVHDPHESPFAITMPLRTLAIGSAVVGFFGVGAWFTTLTGIPNYWDRWLEPVIISQAEFQGATKHEFGELDGLLAQHGDEAHGEKQATDAAHPAPTAAGEHHGGEHHAPWYLELFFAVLSVAVALGSMRFAWTLYAKHPDRPAAMLKAYAPGGPKAGTAGGVFYRWAYNKYYVDEIYEETAIKPVMQLSKASGWVDKYLVDGIVNGLGYTLLVIRWIAGLLDKYVVDGFTFLGMAKLIDWIGARVRGVQSGDLQGYLRWVGYGALATIGFYVLVFSKGF